MLIGTMVRLSATFRVPAADDGTLTDPTATTLSIRLPDATLVSSTFGGATGAGTIVKDATGTFHADYLPASAGSYRWRWAGTGTATAAAEGAFTIEASAL